MKGIAGFLILLCALSGCGAGTNEFIADHSGQQSLDPGVAETLTLLSGAEIHFPAAAFAVETIVVFADVFASSDGTPAYFPTATMVAEDLVAGLVINTPADAVMGADFDVRFRIRDGVNVTVGQEYAVYRYDFDNLRWNRWGDTFATVQSAGADAYASATLPTNGMQGFIGSLALFVGNTTDVLPAVVPTTLEGTVYDENGDPLATDVAIYFLIGTNKAAAAVTNGRIPTGGTIANTVDSAADGSFTLQIPENLIGQLVALEFGREDATRRVQTEFDVLAPASPVTAVESMVVRYGENNINSQRVITGNDV